VSRIVVVGAGVVGTATGQGFARGGHHVTFVDNNPDRVKALCDQGSDASTEIDLRGPRAFIFLTLPTPAIAGVGYDLSSLAAGVAAVGTALRGATTPHVIVVRSTVPPRTCDGMVASLLEEYSGQKTGRDYAVASAPEFLRAMSAFEDFLSPWMTVLASRDEAALAELIDLFRPFGGRTHIFTDPVVAEFIKLAHNAFNATKISFWNEMWQLCQELQINADDVATTVAYSAEGSTNPLYGIRGGFPYSSACLPKDIEGLLGFGRSLDVDMPLVRSVKRVNESIAQMEHSRSPVSTWPTPQSP
jgi:UDPglucose 6-dehydrogenase